MSEEDEDIRIIKVTGQAVKGASGCAKMYLPGSWIGKRVVVDEEIELPNPEGFRKTAKECREIFQRVLEKLEEADS